MKCTVCSPTVKNLALLVARLIVGAVFIYAGWMKLSGFDQAVGMFAAWNYPAPAFFAGLVGVVELLGGAMVLLGVWTTMASAVLAAVMVVAIITVYGDGLSAVQAPLVLLAANAALMAAGGGDWKVWKKDCAC